MSGVKLEIRKAGLQDIFIIHELAHQIWPVTYENIISAGQIDYMLDLIYSEKALTKQIEILRHQFIIIEQDAVPIGFASYSPKYETDPTIFRLNKLYVVPGMQNGGKGKLLVNSVIGEIKKAGALILELNVNRHNPAIYFYKKLEFEVINEEDIDIGNGFFMNDFIMQKQL